MEIDAQTKRIDHLGLVSAMCDEIDLAKTIDQIMPPDIRKVLTVGECVKIMVLNGLAFTGKPLYLVHEAFQNTPLEKLIKPGITIENINDDTLGRALDRIYEANPTMVFARVASKVRKYFDISTEIVHCDTSSKVMYGEYKPEEGMLELVKYGYSKDKRPDLKQILFSLVMTNDGNFPLFGGIIPGNTSDAKHFLELAKIIKENMSVDEIEEMIMVFDAAASNKEMFQEVHPTIYVIRVSETIKEAKEALKWALEQKLTELDEGYSGIEIKSNYAGIEQRWLIVQSDKAYKGAEQSIRKSATKEKEAFGYAIKKLNQKGFSCESDAQKALKKEEKKIKFHFVEKQAIKHQINYTRPGKPNPEDSKIITYFIEAELSADLDKIKLAAKKKSMFIIATNQLAKEKLDSKALLLVYKDQSKAERGNRFLKNPLCLAEAVYLKNQERIVALGAIILIIFLVYTCIEYKLRKKLQEHDQSIPNQVKKPTQKPTARRVFELFSGIDLLTFTIENKSIERITNVGAVAKQILTLMGERYLQMYLLV